MGCCQRDCPSTAAQDGLPQSCISHVEDVGAIGQHVDVTEHS